LKPRLTKNGRAGFCFFDGVSVCLAPERGDLEPAPIDDGQK